MKKFLVLLLFLTLVAGPAMAGMEGVDNWANSSNYFQKLPGMLTRGATNILVTPFDLIMGFVNEAKENPAWYTPVTGLFRGAQDVADRGGRALMDIGGSIFPDFNGFPNYKPCPITGMNTGSSATTA